MQQHTIAIARSALDSLRAEADRAFPRECCGIMFGAKDRVDTIRPAPNIAAKPHTRFEIDPAALIDAYRAERGGGPIVAGFYHSHPAGPATPSATDRAMAAGDGRIWAIVGNGDIAFWRDGEDGFEPLFSRPLDG